MPWLPGFGCVLEDGDGYAHDLDACHVTPVRSTSPVADVSVPRSSGPGLWGRGSDPRRPDRGRGRSGPAPGRGEPPRAGGGAVRQPHFGEVGGAEAGPRRARSPGKEGGGRREEGGSRPPWGRGPGAAAAVVA